MVAGDEAEIPLAADRLILRNVLAEELLDASAAAGAEITAVAGGIERIVRISGQQVVPVGLAVKTPIKIKVHVEAGFQCLRRDTPFGNECRLWEFGFDGTEHLLPCLDGFGLVVPVVLDQGVRHIHAEAVAAEHKPETHDIHHRVAGGFRRRRVRGHLPRPVTFGEPVVEGGLALEEVQDIGRVPFAFTADERHRIPFECAVGPDVAIRVFVALRTLAFLEPRMLLTRVPRHQVEQYVDAARVRLMEQFDQIVIGAVPWRDFAVVAHVIAGVFEWRIVARVDPQGVAAQGCDVVEFAGDAGDIPDAVAIRITEALRVDLIEHRGIKPSRPSELRCHAVVLSYFPPVPAMTCILPDRRT